MTFMSLCVARLPTLRCREKETGPATAVTRCTLQIYAKWVQAQGST